jgi:hypothetical protein
MSTRRLPVTTTASQRGDDAGVLATSLALLRLVAVRVAINAAKSTGKQAKHVTVPSDAALPHGSSHATPRFRDACSHGNCWNR